MHLCVEMRSSSGSVQYLPTINFNTLQINIYAFIKRNV